jgi:outer membrane protein assembly factor BamD (BamD/ComL family)
MIQKIYELFDLTGIELKVTPYYLKDGKMIAVSTRDEIVENLNELVYKRDDILKKIKGIELLN